MNVAIVGGGFTGLSAAYELVKKGHRVTVFEKEKTLGGLANGFKQKNWDWHLESAYHHLFTNDTAILQLIHELGLEGKLILTHPITANLISKPGFDFPGAAITLPFNTPLHLLTYPELSIIDKLRTGLLIIIMKLNPFWQPLEWISAKNLFIAIGGSPAWQSLWEPLMIGKFGTYAENVCASWLWARIKKRTQKLYYIQGGFHTLVSALQQAIKRGGGTTLVNTEISSIDKEAGNKYIVYWKKQKHDFDRILFTTSTHIANKIFPKILNTSTQHLLQIPHLHAQTLILETKKPILAPQPQKVSPFKAKVQNTGVYWLNIMDRTFPFLAVVAHTNMIDKKHYGGHHITYFGNYLPDGHPYLTMTKDQLLKKFLPFINRLNPSFLKSSVISHTSFLAPFAQPVHELHYSRRAPKLQTSIPGIFLANMDSIYPWDRGTNYAVELGIKAAKKIDEDAAESF
ncbi:MAG: NAD(P)/FAD-dependent oxidoreductase [Candidatus Gottesmanbacteria bacterium]|nr:NAD(P)/FAD-dependent oxidoreductase [Candidatus Gottesmanbacteria bacterium]